MWEYMRELVSGLMNVSCCLSHVILTLCIISEREWKRKLCVFFLYYVWNKNMRRWIFRRYWLAEKSCRCVTLCIRKFMNVFSFKYSIGSLFIKAPLPREHKRLFCFMFCLWSMCVRPSEQVWCIRTYSVN